MIFNMDYTNLPSSFVPKSDYIRKNVAGSGALVLAKNTGRLLFALRKTRGPTHPLEWNLWGGRLAVRDDEGHKTLLSPEQGAIYQQSNKQVIQETLKM